VPLILFIRHAENDYVKKGLLAGRLPDVHLNENGQAQALALADHLAPRLKKAKINTIYSSPLERALETAAPLAKALGVETTPREGLLETDCGEWKGQALKSLRRDRLWRSVQSHPSLFRFPAGESFADAQHRICREVETLCALHGPKDTIIAVSHADPIKLAVAYYLGMPIDCFQRLVVAPASITTLYIGEKGCQLLSLNFNLSFTQPRR